MQINPDYNTAAYTIRSYEAGEIIVYEPMSALSSAKRETDQENEVTIKKQAVVKLRESFIVTPEKLIENWGVESPQVLSKTHFQDLLDLAPELVILGTGPSIHFPDSQDCLILQQNGIGVEVMDTSAACRTYNFLVADGRNVAAGIFML